MCTHLPRTATASAPVDLSIVPDEMPSLGTTVLFMSGRGNKHVAMVIGNAENLTTASEINPGSAYTVEGSQLALFVMSPSGKNYTRTQVPWAGSVVKGKVFTAADFVDQPEVTKPDARFVSGVRVVQPAKTAQEQADEANARTPQFSDDAPTGVWEFIG